MAWLIVALGTFVGTHVLLAWPPVRSPLVARLGARGFQGVYSLIALATLIGAVQIYKGVPEVPLWSSGPGLYHPAALVMLAGAILFVGSVTPRNRSLAGVPQGAVTVAPEGVLAITRHPMMWAFGLWAVVHGALAGDPATLALTTAIGVLALGGAAAQDAKKRAIDAGWPGYEAQTSYWPFGAQIAGRRAWRAAWPGWGAALGGLAFWLAMTWLHPRQMGAPVVGVWEWLS